MPEFTYEAMGSTGIRSQGTLVAASEREVMTMLDARGLFPVRIAAKKAIAYNRETSRKIEGEALAFVKQNGVTVIEMSAAEKAEMRAKMQPAVKDWLLTQVSSPKVLEEALAAVEAASK